MSSSHFDAGCMSLLHQEMAAELHRIPRLMCKWQEGEGWRREITVLPDRDKGSDVGRRQGQVAMMRVWGVRGVCVDLLGEIFFFFPPTT